MAGHDAKHRFTRRNCARAVWTSQYHAALFGIAHHVAFYLDHILCGDAISDANAILNARIGGFHDAVGGKWRRHEHKAGFGLRRGNRLFDGIKYWDIMHSFTALSGDDATNDIGAVFQHILSVKLRHASGDTLDDDTGVAIEINAHAYTAFRFVVLSLFHAETDRSAASINVVARIIGRPLLARIFMPSSTLVPAKRTITGTSILTS